MLGVPFILAMLIGGSTGGGAADATGRPASAGPANSTMLLVGMGDSYTAEVLVEPQDPASGDCHRSLVAYPLLAARHLDYDGANVACGGAWPQFLYQRNPIKDQPPQSSQIVGADVVALTVGPDGVLGGGKGVIRAEPDDFLTALDEDLEPPLTRAYDSVYLGAPGVQIFVLEYPDILPPDQQGFDDCFGRLADGVQVADAHRNIANLNLKIREIAESSGATFVPTEARFLHHEQCSAVPYAEGLHPNNAGNRQLAAALVAAIKRN